MSSSMRLRRGALVLGGVEAGEADPMGLTDTCTTEQLGYLVPRAASIKPPPYAYIPKYTLRSSLAPNMCTTFVTASKL
eukprot:3832243-Prymnesium_polylepis.2